MWFVIVLSVISCVLIYLFLDRKVGPNDPLIYPGAWPITGHTHLFFGDSSHLCRILKKLSTAASCQPEGVLTIFLGTRRTYMITDPDDVMTVASNCLGKDYFYDFANQWLGEGLLTASVPVWKKHRKLLNPAFNQRVLHGFLGIFNKQAKQLISEFSIHSGKGPFDHKQMLGLNNLETFCLTAMGVNDGEHDSINKRYAEALEHILNIMVTRFQKLWMHSPFIFRWTKLKQEQDKAIDVLRDISYKVLDEKKAEVSKNKHKVENDYSDDEPVKFKAFMDLLLELAHEKDSFTDKQVRDHVDTMIFGGYETSAVSVMYTLVLLGSHPSVQDRVYKELEEVFEKSDRDVERQDLSKLVYLEAVIKESLRIYPIVPFIARYIDKDVQLKQCKLRRGSSSFLSIYSIHRHPMWGPDVNEFKPERWLSSNTLPENPNAFAAFSLGRRMCFGKPFALMSMKTSLSHILRQYRVTADHTKMEFKLDIMMKPLSGHHISVERRQRVRHTGHAN